ncbi:ABC transporter ATP-binding protein [Kaistia dalseonensis]|uniref:Branched-chain amino acid transport system ATP-binding protein/urea transport system ATP-binding protein n=1 Tax=Kaistia dalseonensis TaxID=410840 RepID=A0ABU0H7Q5_9HYPH|nr:ABC transporter ATP-binding protein [Kaistia dalseonensis]MCX5494953.1 ABC transporter ATP-binding protein [Kaistia dalseonensis]MDQ0437534.1 branched-chain amino acid transport system ATP-binding protein/urea transport system ATP-binding protein [Kaistia dalseonensis]
MADRADGLVIEGLVAGYGGGIVLDGISLAIAPGEAVALLGRNGVGKTTLLKTIMGLIRPSAGAIYFAGKRIDRRAPFEIARAGIGYVPQGREVFPDLTVEENLFLGDLTAKNADAVYAHFPALAEKRREPGGRLSGGQQQQLAIGRTLMAKPRLLLLDEPSEGIQPSIVAEIGQILAGIVAATGMGLILVEQNLDMATRLCSRALFVDHGHVVGEEPTAALKADPRRVDPYLAL